MRYQSWDDPRVVLVTGRKVCATAYVDDRAIRYTFGDDPATVWDVLDSRPAFIAAIADLPGTRTEDDVPADRLARYRSRQHPDGGKG